MTWLPFRLGAHFMQAVTQAMAAVPLGTQFGHPNSPTWTREDRKDSLLEMFMCCPIDKCSQNLSFVCKKHAAEIFLRMCTAAALLIQHTQRYLRRLKCLLQG